MKTNKGKLLRKKPPRELGRRYRSLRESLDDIKNCTQEKLGKELGISKAQISDIENAKRYPSMAELVSYHERFGVSLDYLLGKSNSKEYPNQKLAKDLGLADITIKCLEKWQSEKGDDNLIKVLNCLFESGYAEKILKYMTLYLFAEPTSLTLFDTAKELIEKEPEYQNAIIHNTGDITTFLSVEDVPYFYRLAFMETLELIKTELRAKKITPSISNDTSWFINTNIKATKEETSGKHSTKKKQGR